MSQPLSRKMPWELMNPLLASAINPILSNPILQGQSMLHYPLINGVTTINHELGRQMIGWLLTDITGAATIYRSAPLNASTLTLTSNAAVTISLWVF